MHIAIYGAQAIALSTYRAIKQVYMDCNVCAFIVTSIDDNPSYLGGLPVYSLFEFSQMVSNKDDLKIIIATPESAMIEIRNSLKKEGFLNIEYMDSGKFAELQEKYFEKNKIFNVLKRCCLGSRKAEIEVYMAKFWKDKPLVNKYELPDYFIPVEAGAINTNFRVCDILDCEGENISYKNGNYCELTVLYWAWMNKFNKSKYYGLAHYRRYLILNEEDLSRLQTNDIDVVLPFPMQYEPNIEIHHNRYLSKKEWSAVLQALKELYPEYAKAYENILNQKYFYNYNIVIAKREVMDDYCEWLFSILFRVEEIVDFNGNKKPNRYIGYIGENLTTLYFMYNRNKLKISHTGCKFLV